MKTMCELWLIYQKKDSMMIMSKPHKTGLVVTKSEHRQEEPIDSSDDKRVVRPFVLG